MVDLFVGVADVFLKFLPLEAKLLGTHHRHLSDQRPWPHLALKILRNNIVVGVCSADGSQLFGSEIVHSLSSRFRWISRTVLSFMGAGLSERRIILRSLMIRRC